MTKRLSEVTTKIGSGATPKGGQAAYFSEGISLIRSLNVYDGTFEPDGLAFINEKQAAELSNVAVEENDVLLNITGASVARCCRPPPEYLPARVNQHVSIIRPIQNVLNSQFLCYLLISKAYKDTLLQTGEKAGATRQAITKAQLLDFLVTFPPLPEQQRVVTILDEAFNGLAVAAANAEYNLNNARELFDSYLNDIFTKRGEGWREVSLGQIAAVKGGKRVPKGYKLLTERTAFPYLRVTDFNDDGSIDMSDLRYVSAEVHRAIARYNINSKDMYVSIAGTIGKTGIIPEKLNGANLTENACRLVFKPEVNNRFVYYFSKTNDFVAQAGVNTRVAAQPKLALIRLSSIKLGLPSIFDQLSIVDKLDAVHEETRQLELFYRAKLSAITELKESILNKAFTGELTSQPSMATLETVA